MPSLADEVTLRRLADAELRISDAEEELLALLALVGGDDAETATPPLTLLEGGDDA